MAFLLYNESIIAELREHEKNRVDLYAHLISFTPQASEGQIPTLFTEVITKVDFPRIITNHRGEIIQAEDIDTSSLLDNWAFWRSEAADAPVASTAQLQELIEEMDVQNPPIPFYWSPETLGRLYREGGRVIIADTQGAIAAWQGTNLPASSDTSTAALVEVQRAWQEMEAGEPLLFSVPAASFSYLHWDTANAIVTDAEGQFRAWVGAGLPLASDDPTQAVQDQLRAFVDSLSNQRSPLEFQIPAEHYIHYGDTSLVGRISLAPFVQIGVLVLFLLVGYIGYRNIKRSQQRSLWVGMAKETAHQLGTPLSSLSGWLELLRGEAAAAEVGARRALAARRSDDRGDTAGYASPRPNRFALQPDRLGTRTKRKGPSSRAGGDDRILSASRPPVWATGNQTGMPRRVAAGADQRRIDELGV